MALLKIGVACDSLEVALAASLVFDNRIQIHTEDLSLFFFVLNNGALPIGSPLGRERHRSLHDLEIFWLSYKGHTVNALAQEGDEGRDKLR
uniref:Uncharacterized protein n=1 Tax=uncultured bacterium HF0500_16O16 TaxID=542511 RepID=E0XYG0_9BACT|nr:hypothetical protein [uncultured bacterium HF0500_16O16]